MAMRLVVDALDQAIWTPACRYDVVSLVGRGITDGFPRPIGETDRQLADKGDAAVGVLTNRSDSPIVEQATDCSPQDHNHVTRPS